jgi:hypothetical protein
MVTLTGPALSTPIDFAQSSVAALALDRLKQRPVPTEAQAEALVTLDSVRAEMKEAPKKAAAAKVDYLRSKLDAIKLAAASASATGDIGFTRSATREVRALTKELTQALKDAGVLKETALPGEKPAPAERPGTDLDQASEGGKEVVKELKQVVDKLRLAVVAARIRGASPEEIKEVEKAPRDGEKELQSLAGSLAAKPSGPLVDVDA